MRLILKLMVTFVDRTPRHNFSNRFLQAKLETKALKAKRPGFTDDRYSETSYYVENGKIIIVLFFLYFFSRFDL